MIGGAKSWSQGYVAEEGGLWPGSQEQPWASADSSMFNADGSGVGLEMLDDFRMTQYNLRQKLRKQFQKTQYCRYYFSAGCRKGVNCEFAHSKDELSDAPYLRRTSICKHWLEGKCTASADTCKFAHGNRMLRRTIDADLSDCLPSMGLSSESSPVQPDTTLLLNRRMTTWQEKLIVQQEQQQEMKRIIQEQQKTIDALLRMQAPDAATAAGPKHPQTTQMYVESLGTSAGQQLLAPERFLNSGQNLVEAIHM